MRTVNIGELKNQLSGYLQYVKNEEEVVIRDRSVPVRRGWRELQPGEALRAHAETFLMTYPPRAADALQLAAAWTWCSGTPQACIFISGDTQLLEAAQQIGFQIAAV